MPRERDWADSEDHDYLNGWVGKTIESVTTGIRDDDSPWIRLHFRGGRVVEIIEEGTTTNYKGATLTVQDVE